MPFPDSGLVTAGMTLSGGRYAIERTLGQGGMAEVFQAHDTALDRTVAVKLMRTGFGNDSDSERHERFRREAQGAARLNHPQIVAVYDVGEHRPAEAPPVPYLVMELVRGETLSDILAEHHHAPLPLGHAKHYVKGVLAALQASHESGLVHRDIKPANIMVTVQGTVKVMDFGIARAMDTEREGTALTRTGFSSPGSPHYMAPEQIEGRREVDGRCDLYAVGVLLFQLLSGAPPFDAMSTVPLLYKHIAETPPTLRERGVEVPDEIERLLARALAKSPEERFPDAAAMYEMVDAIQPSSGPAPPRPTSSEPALVPEQQRAPDPLPTARRTSGSATEASGPPPVRRAVPQGGTPAQPRQVGPPGSPAPPTDVSPEPPTAAPLTPDESEPTHAPAQPEPGSRLPAAQPVRKSKILQSYALFLAALLVSAISGVLSVVAAAIAVYGAYVLCFQSGILHTLATQQRGATLRVWQLIAGVALLANTSCAVVHALRVLF